MSGKHLVAAAMASFLMFLVVFMPASAALRFVSLPPAFSYQSVSGSVWDMEFAGTSIYGRHVGSLKVQPGLSTLAGGLDGQVEVSGPSLSAGFDMSMGDRITVRNLDMTTGLSGRVAAFVLDGAVRVQGANIELEPSGRCVSAAGTVRTTVFEEVFASLGMSKDVAEAELMCSGGYLQTSFSRMFAGGELSVSGSIVEPSVVDMDLLLRFDEQAAIPQEILGWLESNGFTLATDGWRATMKVRL